VSHQVNREKRVATFSHQLTAGGSRLELSTICVPLHIRKELLEQKTSTTSSLLVASSNLYQLTRRSLRLLTRVLCVLPAVVGPLHTQREYAACGSRKNF
jgi:hypothetical protein